MVPNQVTGEGISSEDDIEVDAPQNVANYERSARLDAALASVMARGHEQLVADLKIQSHLSEGYVPSEVIVTLVLSGYGNSVLRLELGTRLQKRLVAHFRGFLKRNPAWEGLAARSSESQAEAISYVFLQMLNCKGNITFPEVAFGSFVTKKLLDWFISQTKIKNSMPSADSFSADGSEDAQVACFEKDVPENRALSPDVLLQEKQDDEQWVARCQKLFNLLTDKQRIALTLTELDGMTQKEAGGIMGLTEDAVRQHVASAKRKLQNGDFND